ncbi:phage scaffolding protein [Coprococcus comes]|uniref:Phage minor structural protein GP20 n=1 Tax=Coprococcus comes TaxID=410072 RepID=A0A3R6D4M7_9FIRM|nr:phage scaffolding protein [Coprococcus comes]RHF82029.1 hypothetical protein DW656_12135 [Coprococcus comes]
MKTEDLKEQGLTDEQIQYIMKEYGKDVKKLQKDNETLTADRDNWKSKAETAEETLKGFDGIDPEQIQKDLKEWQKKAEDAEKDYKEKLYERDFADALGKEFENIKFSSEAAKKQIMNDVKAAGLKLHDGKILGLNDLIAQMKESDATAFVDENADKAKAGAARFTTPKTGAGAGAGGHVSMTELMRMKNENPNLDISSYIQGKNE